MNEVIQRTGARFLWEMPTRAQIAVLGDWLLVCPADEEPYLIDVATGGTRCITLEETPEGTRWRVE